MIFITGATGKVGQELVEQLAAQNVEFRALAHSPASAQKLRAQGIETVEGDIAKPDTFAAALQDVDHLFLLTSGGPNQVEVENGVVDAAKQAGVRHIVKLSVFGADPQSPVLLTRPHALVEQHIRNSGLDYTILRPNSFMQNFAVNDAPTIKAQGAIYSSVNEGRISHVDTRDIAAVAVAALTQSGHTGQTYELNGGEALTYAEVAQKLSVHLGKPINYVAVTDEQARAGMIGAGVPEAYADGLINLFQAYRANLAAALSNDIAQVLGRPPRTLDAYFADNIAAFR